MSQAIPSQAPEAPSYHFETVGGDFLQFIAEWPGGERKTAVMHREVAAALYTICSHSPDALRIWNHEDGSLGVELKF